MLPIRDTQTITQEKDSHLIREWNIFVPGLNRLLDPRRHASPDALKNTKAQVLETGKIMSQLKGSNKSEMTQWLEEETAKLLSDFLQDLHYVYSTCRPTERSWAKLNQYFQNLDAIGDEGLTICDTTESDLCQLGKSDTRAIVREELDQYRNRFDLSEIYGFLVVPTWLGSKQALFEWSELAHEYGVQLFTDYENLGSYDELVSSLKDDKIAGSEDHLSAAALFVNLPLARPAHTYNNLPIESEGLYGSAAAPVAAQLYNRQINEAVAGKLKGHIKGVRLTRMDLRHGHINRLSKLGVIPLGCWDWNQVTAFSNNSLCQGSLPGKNVYDVKRVFNRISLDIADMCNLYLFLPDKPATYQDIKRAIIRYLEKRKDKGNFREYKILYVGPDKNEKGRIQIQLHIQPNFNIKSCTLYMLGMDGEEAPEWEIDMQSALPSEGFSGTNTK